MKTNVQNKKYIFFNQLFDQVLFGSFVEESFHQFKKAEVHELFEDFRIEERGGKPKRKLKSAPGGKVQDLIYKSTRLQRQLEKVTGYSIVPLGKRGTYSYYTESNDFLDIHRDINACDLTLITCLHSTIPEMSPSGALYLYTERQNELLQNLYSDRLWGYETIGLKPGQSILIEGGMLPHGVNPIQQNDQRIISALCYRRI